MRDVYQSSVKLTFRPYLNLQKLSSLSESRVSLKYFFSFIRPAIFKAAKFYVTVALYTVSSSIELVSLLIWPIFLFLEPFTHPKILGCFIRA